MAYETGTATGATDLLDKLRLFAIAQGWTVNRWVSWTSGYELCLQKGSAYFNLRSCQNGSLLVNGSTQSSKYGITLNGSDGYAGGSAWDRQPGYAQRAITRRQLTNTTLSCRWSRTSARSRRTTCSRPTARRFISSWKSRPGSSNVSDLAHWICTTRRRPVVVVSSTRPARST